MVDLLCSFVSFRYKAQIKFFFGLYSSELVLILRLSVTYKIMTFPKMSLTVGPAVSDTARINIDNYMTILPYPRGIGL